MYRLRMLAISGRFSLALMLALLCPNPAAAFSSTPSVCLIDQAGMNANHTQALGVSPGGFSLIPAASFVVSGGKLDLTLSRLSGGQFKGLLIWATDSNGTPIGSWTPSTGFAQVSGCGGKALGQTSASLKSLPATLRWTAPVDTTLGTITFHAVVVAASRADHFVVNPVAVFGAGVLAVEAAGAPAPELSEPRPSPFAGTTSLDYTLPRETGVEVTVHDVSGRLVRRLDGGLRAAGRHSVVWNARDDSGASSPAGIYFVRLLAAGQARFQRVVHLAN